MKLLVIKTQSGLKPVYDSDYESYIKIPLNTQFTIEYKKERNILFHRKYFALLNLAFNNQDSYRLINDLRRDLTITAGFYTEVVNKVTGEVYTLADSISFSKMDDIKFNDLYEKTKNVISKWLGIENKKIDEEIEQYY